MDGSLLVAIIGLGGTLVAGFVGFLGAMLGAWIGREATYRAVELQAEQNRLLETERAQREVQQEMERNRRSEEHDTLRIEREKEHEIRRESAERAIAEKQKWFQIFQILSHIRLLVNTAIMHGIDGTLRDANMVVEYEGLKVDISSSINDLEMALVGTTNIALSDKQRIMTAVLYRPRRADSVNRLAEIDQMMREVVVPHVDPDMYSLMNQWPNREF